MSTLYTVTFMVLGMALMLSSLILVSGFLASPFYCVLLGAAGIIMYVVPMILEV